MLQNECNLRQPIDPAGGSWYVETLTKQVSEKIWAVLQQVEGDGGMVKLLQDGTIQKDITDVLNQRFKKLAQRADRAVGVNMYTNMTEKALEKPEVILNELQKIRATQIQFFVNDVDEEYRNEKLGKIAHGMSNESGELVQVIEAAFAAGATLEEVTNSLHAGEIQTIDSIVEKHRFTEHFEALRDRAKAWAEAEDLPVQHG